MVARSSQQVFDDVTVDVGQPTIDAVVPHCQFLVIDAEQVQDRGMDIITVNGIEEACRLAGQHGLVALLRRIEPIRNRIRQSLATS
jgi:hypothetical protein